MRETITFDCSSWRVGGGASRGFGQARSGVRPACRTRRKRTSGRAARTRGFVPQYRLAEPCSAGSWDKTLTRSKQAAADGSRGVASGPAAGRRREAPVPLTRRSAVCSPLQRALGNHTRQERLHLRVRERRVEQIRAGVKSPEQVHDVVHPLVATPTSRARRSHRPPEPPARSRATRADSSPFASSRSASGYGSGRCAPERQHPARHRQHHQRVGDRLARERGQPALRRLEHRRPPRGARRDGPCPPHSPRPSSSAVTYGASSASPISGCSRVCSCSPISQVRQQHRLRDRRRRRW